MALTLLAANNAQTVLAAGINATATTLTVNTGTGNLFPSPVSGTSFFKLTLVDSATGSLSEIVHVTSRTGDTMTIERAQEGTTARIWSANDIAANMLTAGSLQLYAQKDQSLLISNNLSEIADAGPDAVAQALSNLHLEETVNLAKNALRVSPKSLTVDLNTLGAIDSAGVYAQTLDANATTANHYPINQAGTLVVTPSAYGCQQEYTSFSSGRKFTRGLAQVWNGIDGPWKNWVEFYGTTNKPTASDVGALAGNGVAGEAAKLGVASNSDMQSSPGSAELLTTVAAVMSVLPTRAMSSTDYIRIPDKPGGLIIQWGTTPIIPKASWVDVTFPIPFPSSFLSLMAIFKEANSGCIEYRPYSGASLLTGCQIGEGGAAHYSGSNRAIYIAIGQ